MEEWKDAIGFPNYQVSNMGRVRSFLHSQRYGHPPEGGHILHGAVGPTGFRRVHLRVDGKPVAGTVCKMVASAFLGEQGDQHLYHLNGNNSDDRLENLAYRTGRSAGTEQRPPRKSGRLNKADVLDIRNSTEPASDLAIAYGVSVATIHMVKNGTTWSHVGGPTRSRAPAHTVTYICKQCGCSVVRKQKPSARVNLFCNRKCYMQSKKGVQPIGWKNAPTRTREQHHGWKGNNLSQVGGRKRALKWFSKKPCESCGSEKSERHHKDGNTLNNDSSNIAFLCRRCHMVADGRILGPKGKNNASA